MFSRGVEDPDGYVSEIMWMDVAAHAANSGCPLTK
jgi:predicted lactoylglutathione lyase